MCRRHWSAPRASRPRPPGRRAVLPVPRHSLLRRTPQRSRRGSRRPCPPTPQKPAESPGTGAPQRPSNSLALARAEITRLVRCGCCNGAALATSLDLMARLVVQLAALLLNRLCQRHHRRHKGIRKRARDARQLVLEAGDVATTTAAHSAACAKDTEERRSRRRRRRCVWPLASTARTTRNMAANRLSSLVWPRRTAVTWWRRRCSGP